MGILAIVLLLAGLPAVAGGASFSGTYKGEADEEVITAKLDQHKDGTVAGSLILGGYTLRLSGRVEGGRLVGTAVGEIEIQFSATLAGNTLRLSSGSEAYTLKRVGAPAGAAPSGPPSPIAARVPPPKKPGARPKPSVGAGTPADSEAGAVRINGVRLSAAVLRAVEQQYRTRIPPGAYWYDPMCGAWGREGGPTAGFVLAGVKLGGPLRAGASRGKTGVFINGRELPDADVLALRQLGLPCSPGRYWVNAQGLAGYEGGPALVDLAALIRQVAGGHPWLNVGNAGYTGGDGKTTYFFDPKTGASAMTGE